MPEVRTSLLVDFKERGYAEMTNKTMRLAGTASKALDEQAKGFSRVDEEVEHLRNRFRELAAEQTDLARDMEKMPDRASDAYKKLASRLKEVSSEGSRVERTMRQLERAFQSQTKEAEKAETAAEKRERKQGLWQGLVQGAVPGGQFIQRGPGMRRQMIGMGIGGALRGMAGGMAATPFAGAQGISQALGAIPVVGGALAAPFQMAAGFGQMARGFQTQRAEAAPFLSGAFARRRALQRRVGAQAAAEGTIDDVIARERASLIFGSGGLEAAEEAGFTMPGVRRGRGGPGGRARRRLAAESPGAIGLRMGMSEIDMLQFMSGIGGVAGGTGEELMGPGGFLPTAAAARRRYGVQAPVAGAFLRGQRMGAVAGGGTGAENLTSAIADAMAMGLEGADINMYLQQIAAGIQQFEQTGIPIARGAIAEFGMSVARTGIGGVRAANIARGFVGAAQGLSQRGPQSAADLMMLQTMGGFEGGGAEDFERAQIQLEQMRGGAGDPKAMQEMVQRLIRGGGGGASGRIFARRQLGAMGIRVGAAEMQQLAAGEMVGPMQGGGGPQSPEDLQNQALNFMQRHGANLQKQAENQNRQLKIGEKMIPHLDRLESASGRLAKEFTKLADVPLEVLTKKLDKFVKDMTDEDKSLLDSIREMVTG